MKRIFKNKFTYIFVALVAAVFIFFSFVIGGGIVSYAATSSAVEYDKSYVMDDLKNSKVDGKQFNLKDYAFDSNKSTRVFSFVEYCYSFYANKQDNFGLYIYIYNPQGLDFVYNSIQNKVQFAIGDLTESYNKYSIQFLNASTETNYEGLFLKYKVVLTNSRKQKILDNLNSSERVYRVSGIELLETDKANATEYPASGYISDEKSVNTLNYTYMGYAAGYGKGNTTSTLNCVCAEGDALSLKVQSTYYRPDGTNGKNPYTQDTLNSVYFAVPKEVVDKYGYLSEVHAEWLNAVTSWGAVVGDNAVYSKIYDFVGRNIGVHNSDIGYGLVVDYSVKDNSSYMAYNGFNNENCDNLITQLNWLFCPENNDNMSVSGEKLNLWYKNEFRNIVGDSYGETFGCKDGLKVYKALFDYVDDEIKDYTIRSKDNCSLSSQKWTKSLWAQWFGGDYQLSGSAVPYEMEAIHKVEENEFGTNKTTTCNRLYINVADYDEFKAFYDENKTENYIYLMRYSITDYIGVQAEIGKYSSILYEDDCRTKVDSNAYFFKQNVFIDFDIIDLSFTLDEVTTVIPVVSSPVDIINDATKPPLWTDNKSNFLTLIAIIGVCLIVSFVVVVFIKIGSAISMAKTGNATKQIYKEMKRWKK